MDANTMKRMIVLKNLQSNMIEEAYVVFKNNVKSHKFEKINKELVKEKKEENRTKDYMLKEAEMIINDYICKMESKEFKFNNKLPPERVEMITKLTRSQFPIAGQMKRYEKRILEIEDLLSNMKNGRIKVSDTIYPGTRLSVNNILKNIQSEYKRCTIFLNQNGEVEVGAY